MFELYARIKGHGMAMQSTPENLDELSRVFPTKPAPDCFPEVAFFLEVNGEDVPVPIGSWIIGYDDGTHDVFHDETFQRLFRKV